MVMTVPPIKQAGTYYLWPGLQDTGNTGVYQEVLDGRKGAWWIGAGWCCRCVPSPSHFIQTIARASMTLIKTFSKQPKSSMGLRILGKYLLPAIFNPV